MYCKGATGWLASGTLALVVLLSGGPLTPGHDAVHGQDASSMRTAEALAAQEVFGFLPYWELSNADSIDLATLTTVAWFGLEAGRDGQLIREASAGEPTPGWAGWNSDAFEALLERTQRSGVRLVLTVERFSWDQAGRRTTKALLADPQARKALVADILDTITTRGAQGVNLDFEPLPTHARRDFVHLVRELRAAFDAVDPSLQLTFDLTPDVASYPLERLTGASAADAVILMGYEYRTSASRVAGSVAPLRDPDDLDVRDSVRQTLARVSAQRVILALPWYGRAWSTRDSGRDSKTRRSDRYISPSTALYRSAIARAAVAGRHYDQTQESAWSVYRSRADEASPLSWRQLWYDDVDSVRAKVGFARRKELRGVGIWALGYEGAGPELWSALRHALRGTTDEQEPIGGATIAADSIVGEYDGLPLVDGTVRVELSASDGPDGSGVAFVRLATRGRLRDNGALWHGTTFPAGDTVRIALPNADPVDEVFIPGASAEPPDEPAAEDPPSGLPPSRSIEPLAIRVQWRDVAGNWSMPVQLRVAMETASRTPQP